MKMVGDAVYNYPGDVTTIGIASWGIVRGKEQLIRSGKKKVLTYYFIRMITYFSFSGYEKIK